MKIVLQLSCLGFIATLLLTSCATHLDGTHDIQKTQDTLVIYADGRMKFNDRFVNPDDVVIYEDGSGGEKAALKLIVPLHPDFYRDSIRVKRQQQIPTVTEQ